VTHWTAERNPQADADRVKTKAAALAALAVQRRMII
jgi:hypothetical protein